MSRSRQTQRESKSHLLQSKSHRRASTPNRQTHLLSEAIKARLFLPTVLSQLLVLSTTWHFPLLPSLWPLFCIAPSLRDATTTFPITPQSIYIRRISHRHRHPSPSKSRRHQSSSFPSISSTILAVSHSLPSQYYHRLQNKHQRQTRASDASPTPRR